MAVAGVVADVPLVLVTGVTGFIASHVAQQLLKQGEVRVRGTMRSLKDMAKIKALKDMVPDASYQLELVEAELQNEESWKHAVKRCEYVYHLASPFPLKAPRDENEVIKPAVDGALNVLKACAESGTVKRVVFTSSIAAISAGLNAESGRVYTEEDWAPEGDCAPYEKSKLKAERAAWDFVKQLDQAKKFELVVVNPAVVIGPCVGPSKGASSGEVVRAILANDIPALANVNFPLVDVRDVAAGHIAAMNRPGAAGQRYILYDKSMWAKEVAEVISKEFSQQGYKIKSWVMPKAGVWVGKFFSTPAKVIYPALGKKVLFENAKMKNELGVHPMDLAQSVIDTCYSFIDNGVVHKTPGYQPSRSKTVHDAKLATGTEVQEKFVATANCEEKFKNDGGQGVPTPALGENSEVESEASGVSETTKGQCQWEKSEVESSGIQDQEDQTRLEQTSSQPCHCKNGGLTDEPKNPADDDVNQQGLSRP